MQEENPVLPPELISLIIDRCSFVTRRSAAVASGKTRALVACSDRRAAVACRVRVDGTGFHILDNGDRETHCTVKPAVVFRWLADARNSEIILDFVGVEHSKVSMIAEPITRHTESKMVVDKVEVRWQPFGEDSADRMQETLAHILQALPTRHLCLRETPYQLDVDDWDGDGAKLRLFHMEDDGGYIPRLPFHHLSTCHSLTMHSLWPVEYIVKNWRASTLPSHSFSYEMSQCIIRYTSFSRQEMDGIIQREAGDGARIECREILVAPREMLTQWTVRIERLCSLEVSRSLRNNEVAIWMRSGEETGEEEGERQPVDEWRGWRIGDALRSDGTFNDRW